MSDFATDFRKIFDEFLGAKSTVIDVHEMARRARVMALDMSKQQDGLIVGNLDAWMAGAIQWLCLFEARHQLIEENSKKKMEAAPHAE